MKSRRFKDPGSPDALDAHLRHVLTRYSHAAAGLTSWRGRGYWMNLVEENVSICDKSPVSAEKGCNKVPAGFVYRSNMQLNGSLAGERRQI
jgi:hypothetical protein